MAKRRGPRGVHTGPNVWDDAAALEVWRGGEKLDPGVNFFVLMLDQMGFRTHYSCEGHPGGFYVTFDAPYEAALDIAKAGFFAVEVEKREFYWSIRYQMETAPKEKLDAFRWAAETWEKRFGPLDFDQVMFEA